MSDKFKKLTGKNPKDFEPVAYSLINNCDIELFQNLYLKKIFFLSLLNKMFATRLEKVCNEKIT